jgi:hypothetical protein
MAWFVNIFVILLCTTYTNEPQTSLSPVMLGSSRVLQEVMSPSVVWLRLAPQYLSSWLSYQWQKGSVCVFFVLPSPVDCFFGPEVFSFLDWLLQAKAFWPSYSRVDCCVFVCLRRRNESLTTSSSSSSSPADCQVEPICSAMTNSASVLFMSTNVPVLNRSAVCCTIGWLLSFFKVPQVKIVPQVFQSCIIPTVGRPMVSLARLCLLWHKQVIFPCAERKRIV